MKTNPPKPSLLSRSADNLRPRFPRAANLNIFDRPLSAFALHHVHELSDIREVSGSSRAGTVRKRRSAVTTDGAAEPKPALPRSKLKNPSDTLSSDFTIPTTGHPDRRATGPKELGSGTPSATSLPLADIPLRRSSASFLGGHSATGSQNFSISDSPSWKLPGSAQAGQKVPPSGRADSPVRAASSKDTITTEMLRNSASHTFIRTSAPLDVLENGSLRHPRVDMTVRLPSPLFVGGGTIEGQIVLKVDANATNKSKLKPMHISRLSIDIIGVEEVSDGRRWIFLSLATELFDQTHPPPPSLVSSQHSASNIGRLWPLKSGTTAAIPFCINLPLNIGPPPYLSRQAAIRYLFCPTATFKVTDKQCQIRQTWNIQMLTVHDPEKALASLADPLLATDTVSVTNNGQVSTCKLTAGLHRQTWVNGAAIFVDTHIANKTSKSVKKIEVQIEKSTIWYAHAAAGTIEKSASHLRLPKKTNKEFIASSITKKSREWDGVAPYASEVRTCNIDVPRGHVTISTGRYFEVRYFLNVTVTVGMFKDVTVQMPITLIHLNSLDILPNSLAQVAAAIELKRARTVPVREDAPLFPPYHQGQAFTAPRRQSLDQRRSGRSSVGHDISALAHDLESSPRKYGRNNFMHHHYHNTGTRIATSFGNRENMAPREPSVSASSLHQHLTKHPSCYHCHLLHVELDPIPSPRTVRPDPKLLRLQLSTSGLGFSDSDFEIAPDSPPRKVMLSESERKMINQQKELNLQREASQQSRQTEKLSRATGDDDTEKERTQQLMQDSSRWGWKNVAASPKAVPRLPDYGNRSRFKSIAAVATSNVKQQEDHPFIDRERFTKARTNFEKKAMADTRNENGPTRARSRTNPESMGMNLNVRPHRYRRAARSADRTSAGGMPRLSVDETGPRSDRRRTAGRNYQVER